jgi:hypothetical protein
MDSSLRIALTTTPEQFERLRTLQVAFAEVCNAIAPVVQSTRCWNRVALHHLVYRNLRERFPALGSQMLCNAIYSVSRAARIVYQHPKSRWNVGKNPGGHLPVLRFRDSAPVYFDRHTLSLKDGVLSMFTLDGRMRFALRLAPSDEIRFQREKLLEVVLVAATGSYELTFHFANPENSKRLERISAKGVLPEYVVVFPAESTIEPRPSGAEGPPKHHEADRPAAP